MSSPARESLPIPEHTVIFLTTDSEDEAHYVSAVLNSDPVNEVVSGYVVDNHLSTHPIENVQLPRFDPRDPLHRKLSELSRKAHLEAAKGDGRALRQVEDAISEIAPGVWK